MPHVATERTRMVHTTLRVRTNINEIMRLVLYAMGMISFCVHYPLSFNEQHIRTNELSAKVTTNQQDRIFHMETPSTKNR